MKINPKYGDRIITIPAAGVLDNLPGASRAELSVLIYTLANQSCTMDEAMEGTGLERDEVAAALSKWKSYGVLTYTGAKSKKTSAEKNCSSPAEVIPAEDCEKAPPQEENKNSIIIYSNGRPCYSTAELTEMVNKNKNLKDLIDACNQALKKILKTPEIETIVHFSQYLNLEDEYILLLCSRCESMGKTSLRYIEKTATELFDRGITTYSLLEEYFTKEDEAKSLEGKIKKLYGFGERALSKAEKNFIMNWVSWGYSYELIEKAYDITVANTPEPKLNYTNKVIENWHSAGLKTEEAIDSAAIEYKKKKGIKGKAAAKNNPEIHSSGSFDTDDFFEAALRRSYEN